MITIFRGRKLSLQGTEDVIYAEVAVALRDQIHHFNTGKSCNPFAVFMKIALHTDEYGWAFPSSGSISAGTGISTAHALAGARTHLQQVRIDGHRVLEAYRERRSDGTFGRHLYRIFPDAWTDGLAHIPTAFDATALIRVTAEQPDDLGVALPHVDNPHVDDPHAEEPHVDHRQHKKNHSMKEHQGISSGSAGSDSTVPFEPCALAQFIEAHSKYRFKPGGQHGRLLRVVPDRERRHPAPNDLYLDGELGEVFNAWVLTKIGWAEEEGHRKPLKSLVSAICNYAQPQFGWLAFWNQWAEQRGGVKSERGGETSGDPGRTTGAGGGPSGQEGSAQQRHRQQVARFLANAGRPLG